MAIRRRTKALTVAGTVALAAGLAVAAPSGAEVTIGSSMAASGDTGIGCAGTCTYSQSALPGRMTTSPVNGTVVSWGIEVPSSGDLRFRVIRTMGASSLFVSGTASESVPGAGVHSFTSGLPISAGDRIGVDHGVTSPGFVVLSSVPGATGDRWGPAPADGATATPTAGGYVAGHELLLNAEIKPTNTFTASKPKALKNGNAQLTVTLPNAGTLTFGGTTPAAAGGLVKLQTLSPSAAGDLKLTLKPSQATRKKLKKKGKANGTVSLVYGPTFGDMSIQTVQVKLKLKPKQKPKRG